MPWPIVGRSMYKALMDFDKFLVSLPAAERFVKSIAFVNDGQEITTHVIRTFDFYLQLQAKHNLSSTIQSQMSSSDKIERQISKEGTLVPRQSAVPEPVIMNTSK